MRFPRARRVQKRSDFLRIQNGPVARIRTPHLLVLASPRAGSDQLTRLGIVASRKVGPAVARNRAKRLVREAFRRTAGRCPERWDVVVIVRAATVDASVEALARELARAFRSLPLAAEAPRSQADPRGRSTPPERS